jgi:hypothetical protein
MDNFREAFSRTPAYALSGAVRAYEFRMGFFETL